jgi:multiple sugar transport system permease protein
MQETLVFDQYRRRQRNAKITRGVLWYVVVGSIAVFMLYPVVWLVASSLKAPDEIWTNVASLIPSYLRWENYAEGWSGFGGITFSTFFQNSFIVAGFGTLFTVVSSAVVAYGFARVKFIGSGIWFSIMLLTLMLPSQILMIPQYIIFAKLDWINTFTPLLLPRLGGDVFFIFMIVQFIRGIPIDLDEAAMIDGASKVGIFYRIILPQIVPALVTASIFSFYWTWEDILGPLVYLQSPTMYTVSVALRAYADTGSVTNWGAVFAMLSASLVPVILIFVFFQRYLVQGIATTGLKG